MTQREIFQRLSELKILLKNRRLTIEEWKSVEIEYLELKNLVEK